LEPIGCAVFPPVALVALVALVVLVVLLVLLLPAPTCSLY
jgi:hypothetical protein